MRFQSVVCFAVAVITLSLLTESAQAQLFRRGDCCQPARPARCCKLKRKTACCPAPCPPQNCCPAPAPVCGCTAPTPCCGAPAPCCGAPMTGQVMVPGGQEMAPSVVVTPDKQSCQDEYTACMAECAKKCSGPNLEACQTFCQCRLDVCTGSGDGPCPVPPCLLGPGGGL